MTITPFFWGPERLVNTQTTSIQNTPDVAVLANGNYVVTWRDNSNIGGDNNNGGVKAQLYNAAGEPIGGEFLVNTTTFSLQHSPSVTALANGGFVIAFNSGVFTEIRAQVFNADGSPNGTELLLSSDAKDSHLIALANGGFAAVWEDSSGANDNLSVQRFDASGTPTDPAAISVTAAAGDQANPKFAELSGGTFVVVWEDRNDTGTGRDIKAQLFNANGTKNGGEFTVNSTLPGSQTIPDVITLANGNFVVAWQDTANTDVSARIFNATGVEVVGEFDISTNSGNRVDLVALADGGFVAVWNTSTNVGNANEIELQRLDASGNAVGTAVTVNTTGSGDQEQPAIDVTEDGRLIVVWEDQGQNPGDTSDTAVRSQILALTNDHTVGTSSGETLNGTGADNAIYGWEGDDTINGNDGDDILNGGDGNDTLNGGQDADILSGGDDNDTLDGGGGNDTHFGDGGDDTFLSNAGTDSYHGGEGSDTVDYSTHGGATNIYNLVDGFFSWSTLVEQLTSIENLITGAGRDTITTSDADNTIDANNGDDTILASLGLDTIDGGTGVDTFDLSNLPASILNWINLDAGGTQFRVDEGAGFVGRGHLSNIENVQDSSGNDAFYGDANDNTYFYTAGLDTFDGNGGWDTLDISAMMEGFQWIDLQASSSQLRSNDGSGWVANAVVSDTENFVTTDDTDHFRGNSTSQTIVYMGGRDFVDGRLGSDTLDFSEYDAGIWVNLNIAFDQFRFFNGVGYESGGNMQNVENVIGGDGNDFFYADAMDNSFFGGLGNDRFEGGAGTDTFEVDGTLGDYALSEAGGIYTLTGISGTDTLIDVEQVKIDDTVYDIATLDGLI